MTLCSMLRTGVLSVGILFLGHFSHGAVPTQDGVMQRVKDIWLDLYPDKFNELNGKLVFRATEYNQYGEELWISDGTEAGTMVKDIFAGKESSQPVFLKEIGNTLFFLAKDRIHGQELWKTDGTLAGTVLVRDINPGGASSEVQNIFEVNGVLYFRARNTEFGLELWKSDGTETGTVLIKDIKPGPESSDLRCLTVVNGKLYFTAFDSVHLDELWVSDGTEQGTRMVKDIAPGASGSSIVSLYNWNGTLFFNPWDDYHKPGDPYTWYGHGKELWKSDGTEAGTVMVKDGSAGEASTQINYITNSPGMLWYFAHNDASGTELWSSDGTASGTHMVKDMSPGSWDTEFKGQWAPVQGKLVFVARDYDTSATPHSKSGLDLWISDGTSAGTVCKDIAAGTKDSGISFRCLENDKLFLVADDYLHGSELWVSDGTLNGTFMLADINPGELGSNVKILANTNGIVYFTAEDLEHGSSLWKTDGTKSGTKLVKAGMFIDTYSQIYPKDWFILKNKLYFLGGTMANGSEITGVELCVTDGTEAGTHVINDLFPGSRDGVSMGSSGGDLIVINDTIYFGGQEDGFNGRLWSFRLQSTRILRLQGDLVFGEVAIGRKLERTVSLFNDGNAPLTINSLSLPPGFFGNWSGVIPAGGSESTSISFAPTSAAVHSGMLTVNGDQTGGVSTLAVSGFGVVPDLTKPTVSITGPAANARTSNAVMIVQGSASDNVRIARVEYQLNHGSTRIAAGTSNWTAQITLDPGTNVMTVKSIDASGNESTAITRSFYYLMMSPLTVLVQGNGTIAPSLNGKLLEVGKSYKLTAAPGKSNLFAGWSGGVDSTNTGLTFVMRPNLRLQANFMLNPFIALKGSYNGLFYSPEEVTLTNAGGFTLAVTDTGAYSGKLYLNAGTYSWTGRFDVRGNDQRTITRPKQLPMVVNLQLDLTGRDEVSGALVESNWSAGLVGDRSPYDGKTAKAPQAGTYKVMVKGAGDAALAPAGYGVGSATVDAKGAVSFSGTLADGTPVSQSSSLSKHGEWPLYVPLGKTNGLLLSWITITNQCVWGTNLIWIKPQNLKDKLYRSGFELETEMIGARYIVPAAGKSPMNWTNGVAVLSGGNLTNTITLAITWNAKNQIQVIGANPNKLGLTFVPGTGLLNGSFQPPGATRTTQISAVVMPSGNWAAGFFLGTNQSGFVLIH
jgi:ELWxxDGT repeat protein